MISTFTKHWDKNGYTYQEAVQKKAKVDEAHGVGTSKSEWNPAKIEKLPNKSGYQVTIQTKR